MQHCVITEGKTGASELGRRVKSRKWRNQTHLASSCPGEQSRAASPHQFRSWRCSRRTRRQLRREGEVVRNKTRLRGERQRRGRGRTEDLVGLPETKRESVRVHEPAVGLGALLPHDARMELGGWVVVGSRSLSMSKERRQPGFRRRGEISRRPGRSARGKRGMTLLSFLQPPPPPLSSCLNSPSCSSLVSQALEGPAPTTTPSLMFLVSRSRRTSTNSPVPPGHQPSSPRDCPQQPPWPHG